MQCLLDRGSPDYADAVIEVARRDTRRDAPSVGLLTGNIAARRAPGRWRSDDPLSGTPN